MGVSESEELRDRAHARRKQLEAWLAEAKAEGRKSGRESIERIQGRLDELSGLLKDGWERASEAVAGEINDWLRKDDDAG